MPSATVTNQELYKEIELRKLAEAERDQWREAYAEYRVEWDEHRRETLRRADLLAKRTIAAEDELKRLRVRLSMMEENEARLQQELDQLNGVGQ